MNRLRMQMKSKYIFAAKIDKLTASVNHRCAAFNDIRMLIGNISGQTHAHVEYAVSVCTHAVDIIFSISAIENDSEYSLIHISVLEFGKMKTKKEKPNQGVGAKQMRGGGQM